MHKGLRCKSVIFLMLFLSMTGAAIAADNAPISVSCSIPVVPGLNAPPLSAQPTEIDETITQKQDTSSAIEESTQKEIMLADGSTSSLVTQTIYMR